MLLCNTAAGKKQETLVLLSVLNYAEAQEKATGWRKAENIFGCLYHWHVIMSLSPQPHQQPPLHGKVRDYYFRGVCMGWGEGGLMAKHVNIAQNFTENFIYLIRNVKAQVTEKWCHSLISEL